jgi:hypothetical protein
MVAGIGNVFYNINPVNFTITQVLAVDEANGDKDVFVVYPNPSKGLLNIKFGKQNNIYDIAIHDVSGRLVFSKPDNKLDHDNVGTFNLTHLVKGDYLITVKTKDFNKTIKWIKE